MFPILFLFFCFSSSFSILGVETLINSHFLILLGTISSLKSVKKDVAEMRKGTECGMSFHDWADFLAGDQVQCYEEKTEKRYL